MTKPVGNVSPSSSLLRGIGYCLLVLALFDRIDIFVPPRFMEPSWEFQTIEALVERVPVPLLGLELVFYGESDFRSKWELLPLKFLSWASLLIGVLFLLLCPLLLVDSSRLDNQITYQISTEASQQISGLEQLEQQLGKATKAEDIDSVIARIDVQGLPPNIKSPQELKSRLLSEINKAKKTIQSETSAALTARRQAKLKNSAKWLLGVLVRGNSVCLHLAYYPLDVAR